jgi:hypothetical protein
MDALPLSESERVRRGKKPYRRPVGRPPQHGAAMLTRVLRTVRLNTIDRRSEAGVFLRRVREGLVDQLGGDVTPAQRLLIEEAAKTALIAQAVGDFILKQESLVRADASLLPVVVQHAALVGGLTRMLLALGLQRAEKPVETLRDFLAARSNGTR